MIEVKDEFLPLGSAVLLKDATRPIVIIGYMIIEEGSTEIWDYMGCPYPIGVVGEDKKLLFKKNQIEKVLATGYCDKEGQSFLKALKESEEQIKNGE